MTKKQLQKYKRLSKRIVRRQRVTSAETMWVWRMRRAYLAYMRARIEDAA